jgi:hypothetical protein
MSFFSLSSDKSAPLTLSIIMDDDLEKGAMQYMCLEQSQASIW